MVSLTSACPCDCRLSILHCFQSWGTWGYVQLWYKSLKGEKKQKTPKCKLVSIAILKKYAKWRMVQLLFRCTDHVGRTTWVALNSVTCGVPNRVTVALFKKAAEVEQAVSFFLFKSAKSSSLPYLFYSLSSVGPSSLFCPAPQGSIARLCDACT